jgi:hypothetical protein
MSFEDNNEVITGFFEKNETPHRHTATDLLVNMDPIYNFKIAKAAVGATMHYATASTTLNNEAFNNDFQVSFFPNPTKDSLNINKGTLPDTYSFSMVDIEGKTVMSKTIENAQLVEQININQLSKGIYMAILETKDKKVSKKIVIE